MMAAEGYVGRAAGCGGFYGKVSRRTPPTARRSLVGLAGRIHYGKRKHQGVGCLLQ